MDAGRQLRLPIVMRLTDAQIELYREQGYLLLPRLFHRDALARFESRFLQIAGGSAAAPENLVVMQDVMVARGPVEVADPVHGVNKILSFENDPELFAYALDPGLLEAIRALIGPGIQTISTNVFNKPPEVDGRHPLHQDLRYFALRPVDGIVGTWTAISQIDRENGCLAILPESHRLGLLPHRAPDWDFVNSGFVGVSDVDSSRRVHVEMDPGDTLLIHPLLVHGSGRNRSGDCRRAISAHYASKQCTRPPGKRKRVPVVRTIPDEAV
ncbi:MAG: phytanoyl-CoA dioxygenase family protein [Myxococcota bacterium]|nr:phytanoyl-CoA dioxygenase family protein [Myxococcota bacterium]